MHSVTKVLSEGADLSRPQFAFVQQVTVPITGHWCLYSFWCHYPSLSGVTTCDVTVTAAGVTLLLTWDVTILQQFWCYMVCLLAVGWCYIIHKTLVFSGFT